MRNTTEINFSNSPILGRLGEVLLLDNRSDEEQQLSRNNPFHLDNQRDWEFPFDAKLLLDFGDLYDLDDLEDRFDLRISDLRWNDDQTQFDSVD